MMQGMVHHADGPSQPRQAAWLATPRLIDTPRDGRLKCLESPALGRRSKSRRLTFALVTRDDTEAGSHTPAPPLLVMSARRGDAGGVVGAMDTRKGAEKDRMQDIVSLCKRRGY